MSELEQLIAIADRLCNNLDIAAQNEKKYTNNICLELERMNWETLRLMNDLKEIKEYCI